jgi:hypothetical protein
MSKRDAPVAIISMAQQAKPNVMGQRAEARAQLKTKSTVEVIMPLDDSTISSFAIIPFDCEIRVAGFCSHDDAFKRLIGETAFADSEMQ